MNLRIIIDDKNIELEEDKRIDFTNIFRCLLTTAIGPECEWNKANIEINRKTK